MKAQIVLGVQFLGTILRPFIHRCIGQILRIIFLSNRLLQGNIYQMSSLKEIGSSIEYITQTMTQNLHYLMEE